MRNTEAQPFPGMCQKWKIILIAGIFFIIPGVFPNILKTHVPMEPLPDLSFILKVCAHTGQYSNQKLFHVISLNPNFDVTSLINVYYKNLFTIMVADHFHILERAFTHERKKNILFILSDFSDVLNLILGSVSDYDQPKNASNPSVLANSNLSLTDTYKHGTYVSHVSRMPLIPNYCINHNPGSTVVVRDQRRHCDKTINVSDNDLMDNSILPDEMFDHARHLYLNNVWNSENYLILWIPNSVNDKSYPRVSNESLKDLILNAKPRTCECTDDFNRPCNLLFTFRFIWRTFKGHKTIICLGKVCYRYDPFYEKILEYRPESSDEYFSFSWFSMNGRSFSMFLVSDEKQMLGYSNGYELWSWLLNAATEILEQKRGASVKIIPRYLTHGTIHHSPHDYEFGLKYGIDLYTVESGVRMERTDFRKFDSLPTVDTGLIYFAVPRGGYMPQYLTSSMCFTPIVWTCVLMTAVSFFVTQWMYKYFQTRVFLHLYSENELIQYERLSTSLTIYRYFLCIGQPRLLLGKGISGKILFVIFVFAALILATLFQSRMVTLLSKRIRYNDINTLNELRESNLFIQTRDAETAKHFFSREAQFEWVNERLTDNFQLEAIGLGYKCIAEYLLPLFIQSSTYQIGNGTSTLNSSEIFDVCDVRNLDAILQSDAFLSSGPVRSAKLENVLYFDDIRYQKYEYHFVRENVMSYPLIYLILKNSFYRNTFNDILSKLIEGGMDSKMLDDVSFLTNFYVRQVEGKEYDGDLRAFSMTDLQIAFICLIVGLLLGVITFVFELLYQI